MSTILESVNTLSEKLGVTEREQTIKDQLDLCVERLGGEGNSKDIAESAEKFAEKEDGTATFMTKNITENNTYNAADDGVSGYSSVTVNVPSSGGETFEVLLTTSTGETFTPNKSFSETVQHIKNGDSVVIKAHMEDGEITMDVSMPFFYNTYGESWDIEHIYIILMFNPSMSTSLYCADWNATSEELYITDRWDKHNS